MKEDQTGLPYNSGGPGPMELCALLRNGKKKAKQFHRGTQPTRWQYGTILRYCFTKTKSK